MAQLKYLNEFLSPRESGEYIVKNTNDIELSEKGIDYVAEMIHNNVKENNFEFNNFNACDLHIKSNCDQDVIDWIFLIDTINFSFWTDKLNPFNVTYKNCSYTGYFAACACINRALDNGILITNAEIMSEITESKLKEIFSSDSGNTIPLLKERLNAINEAGKVLINKFDGTFYNCVKSCGKSAQNLLLLIIENFESFRDFAIFREKKVSFLKRAQILVSDIYSALHLRNDVTNFFDINTLTMFADYRVPQVLNYLGVLKYSNQFQNFLQKTQILINGSEPEVILRGFSIFACEKITAKIELLKIEYEKKHKKSLKAIFAVDVDMFLWNYRRNHETEIENANIPFHKVRCIYY